MHEPEHGVLELAGRRLAWQARGQGIPLLLLNGYAATAQDWDPGFLTALGQRFRLLCPDARGMGNSTFGDPHEPLSIATMANDARAVLDAIGVDSAVVAGWSMGGFVAQALACETPERVDALVLLGTDSGGPEATRAAPEVWAQLLDGSGTPREQASRLIALLFPPPVASEIDAAFGDVVAQARARLSPTARRAQEAAIEAWYAETPLERGLAAPPVLVACGADDVVIPPVNLDVLAARWPESRTERFAACGHAFMAQEPEQVARLVGDFAG